MFNSESSYSSPSIIQIQHPEYNTSQLVNRLKYENRLKDQAIHKASSIIQQIKLQNENLQDTIEKLMLEKQSLAKELKTSELIKDRLRNEIITLQNLLNDLRNNVVKNLKNTILQRQQQIYEYQRQLKLNEKQKIESRFNSKDMTARSNFQQFSQQLITIKKNNKSAYSTRKQSPEKLQTDIYYLQFQTENKKNNRKPVATMSNQLKKQQPSIEKKSDKKLQAKYLKIIDNKVNQKYLVHKHLKTEVPRRIANIKQYYLQKLHSCNFC